MIRGLFVYPVKGARGIALARADVERRGIRHDRRFMVVDEAGKFVTQRTHPMMALVDVRIEGDALAIAAADVGGVRVPLVPSGGEARRVVIWKDTCDALSLGDDASAFFGELLGMTATLVFMPETTRRQIDLAYARPGDLASFADGYPLLVLSTGSLDALNARTDVPFPMDRFRPSVVVDDVEPFAEDTWSHVHLGALPARVVKPCERCTVTTVDQRTGAQGIEPLKTLTTFRRVGNAVLFGQNVIPDADGELRVGDAVTVDASRVTPTA